LADRAGAVSADTLHRFQQMVTEIAYELSAQVEWIGTQEPLEFAQALDTFCLEVDKTIGFHILNGASGRFTGTKFKGLAEANGLALKDDGAFYAKSKNGQSAFKVINMENNPFGSDMLKSVALKGVTFQMEIALTESCTETFNSMVLMAKSMAHSLSATLVDDHQRELSDAKIEKIRQQLRLIQVQMTVKGIPPGSPVALRLFV
jgi:FtsZ-interacting cell division protein ZipA